MKVEMSLSEFIGSMVPSDIFAPFQMISPFPLIIVAGIATYALCSVGKHFDRLKKLIDTFYALFSRMLSIVMSALPVFVFLAILDILLEEGFSAILYLLYLVLITLACLVFLILFYGIRLKKSSVPVIGFVKKMGPLLLENFKIGSALDAAPYNIRYCARAYGFDRKRLEHTLPVLAQINLDGNCFLITVVAILYLSASCTPLSIGETLAIGLLVLLLSLGAPNQPGSCLLGLTIVMYFMQANDLVTVAFYGEVFFGGILNLTNIAGDMVTTAIEEVRETGNADELNKMIADNSSSH